MVFDILVSNYNLSHIPNNSIIIIIIIIIILEVFGKNNNDVRFFAIPDFGFWPKRCSGKIKDIEFVDE